MLKTVQFIVIVAAVAGCRSENIPALNNKVLCDPITHAALLANNGVGDRSFVVLAPQFNALCAAPLATTPACEDNFYKPASYRRTTL